MFREVDSIVEAYRLVASLRARGFNASCSQSARRSFFVTWQK